MELALEKIRTRLARLDPICPDALPVPIYYINLDRSRDRRAFMEAQLQHAPHVTRIEGIDGTRTYSNPKTNVRRVGAPLTPPPRSKNTSTESPFSSQGITFQSSYPLISTKFGCTLSHLKALTQIERDGHEWALVCEDDAVFTLSSLWPKHVLSNLCEEGDRRKAGIIQLYWAPRSDIPESKYHKFSPYQLVPIGPKPCWGTVAYLVSKKGVQDILEYTGRFPQEDSIFDCATHKDPLEVHQHPTLLYLDDPDKSRWHRVQYKHLKRQKLQGVADSFLYGLTPTFTCGRPLVMYDNCDMDAIVSNTNRPRSLGIQRKILNLYTRE